MESSILSADYSDAKSVMRLLKDGADVNACTEFGNNALHFAIWQHKNGISCLETVYRLLNAGIDVNLVSVTNITALDIAVLYCLVDIVELLLQNGAEVNRENCDTSVLTMAAKQRDENLFKLLLDHGANIDFQNSDGSSPMNFIGFLTDYSTMAAVVERTADIDHQALFTSTPLSNAVTNGNVVLTKLLLEAGADPSISSGPIFSTALHGAILMNTSDIYEIVKVLLVNGVNVNEPDMHGVIPLLYALERCELKVIKLLSEYGADFTKVDNQGNSALHRAVENSNGEVITFVLDKGIDVNIKNQDGRTALHAAAEYGTFCGNPGTCNILLDRGANIQCKDIYEESPLTIFVETRDDLYLENNLEPPREIVGWSLIAHIAKLEYWNFAIDQDDRQLIEDDFTLKEYYDNCKQELEQMKCVIVYNDWSVVDILFASKEKMPEFARDEELVSSIYKLAPVLFEELPIYSSSMLAKFKNEVRRQKQLKKAQKIINNIMGFNNPSHPICRSIASSLEVQDLRNI